VKTKRLGSTNGTYSLLAKLLGTLVLGVLDQFHDTTLIGSESGNLANQITNELGALALDLNKRIEFVNIQYMDK
jgi:hypothetical protein